MLLKVLGVSAGLLGVAMLIFAVMAWLELRNAATSPIAPPDSSMPLTRIVYPELFDAATAGTTPAKPAELAQAVQTRIFIIGGGSLALIVVGIVMLMLPQRSRIKPNDS